MKKLILAAVFACAFFAAQASAQISAVTLPRTLVYGQTDLAVKDMQRFLIAQGYLIATPTNFFGPKTLAAVRAFQKDYGIDGDGTIVGVKTRAAMHGDMPKLVRSGSYVPTTTGQTSYVPPVTMPVVTPTAPVVVQSPIRGCPPSINKVSEPQTNTISTPATGINLVSFSVTVPSNCEGVRLTSINSQAFSNYYHMDVQNLSLVDGTGAQVASAQTFSPGVNGRSLHLYLNYTIQSGATARFTLKADVAARTLGTINMWAGPMQATGLQSGMWSNFGNVVGSVQGDTFVMAR
jgi:hypothetical protein